MIKLWNRVNAVNITGTSGTELGYIDNVRRRLEHEKLRLQYDSIHE